MMLCTAVWLQTDYRKILCNLVYQITDRNFVDNFLKVVIYLALVANI